MLNYGIKKIDRLFTRGKIVKSKRTKMGLVVGALALLIGSHATAMQNAQKMVVICSKEPYGFLAKTNVNKKAYFLSLRHNTCAKMPNKKSLLPKKDIKNRIPEDISERMSHAIGQYRKIVLAGWGQGQSYYTEPPPACFPYDLP